MLQLEQTYFDLATFQENQNCLVICDRGTMDPSACKFILTVLIIYAKHSKTARILSDYLEWVCVDNNDNVLWHQKCLNIWNLFFENVIL